MTAGLLVPHLLGPEGVAHVAAVLAATWKPLGARLLQHHDIGSGTTWAIVPQASAASARRSPVGGTFLGHDFDWAEAAGHWAAARLHGLGTDGVLCVEDPYRSPADLPPAGSRDPVLIHGDAVYDIATTASAGPRIEHLVHAACSHDRIGVVGRLEAGARDPAHDVILDDGQFDRLAASARTILVGGWDEEALIFWEAPSVSTADGGDAFYAWVDPSGRPGRILHTWTRGRMDRARVLVLGPVAGGWITDRLSASGTFAGDTWAPSLDEALAAAEHEYGDALGAWVPAPPVPFSPLGFLALQATGDRPVREIDESHSPPRELLPDERAALEFLLEADFPGVVDLRDQAARARVGRRLAGQGVLICLEISAEAATPPGVLGRIPIEAEGTREDGTPVFLLVHLQDNRLHELETYAADGAPMERFPDPGTLTRLEGPHWRSEGRSS